MCEINHDAMEHACISVASMAGMAPDLIASEAIKAYIKALPRPDSRFKTIGNMRRGDRWKERIQDSIERVELDAMVRFHDLCYLYLKVIKEESFMVEIAEIALYAHEIRELVS